MLTRFIYFVRGQRGLARRIYFGFLAAAVLPTAIAGIIGIALSLHTLRRETLRNLSQEVSIRAQGLSGFFDQLAAELFYLAEAPALDELRSAIRETDVQRIRLATARLERDYSALARVYPYVYQIRFLSVDGHELVRVDRRDGRIIVVASDKLQDKSDRYYFNAAIRHQIGELYVSPLDLNVEDGKIEQPERPVIRVATVVGRGDRIDGVLIVNLHADLVLAQIEQMAVARNGTAYLFDRSGHYLSRSPGEHSGFVMRSVATLEQEFGKGKLAKLFDTVNGTMSAGGNIVAHAAVEFGDAYTRPDGSRWILAVGFPERTLLFSVVNLDVLYTVLVASLLVTAVGGYVLSRRLLGPLEVLAQETEAIAGGDFSRRINLPGDDEIADLGGKFNAMTDRLSGLYRTLEDEVAARTSDLDHERASLAAVIQHTGDGILVASESGTITLANDSARALMGDGGDLVGSPLTSFWPEWPSIAEAVQPAAALRREMPIGSRILAVAVTMTEEAGGRRSLVAVVRDVSEERHLQDERRELDRQMFQMEKMATMGELAMGLAHEIGNPLAGMKAVTQALQYEEDLPPGIREALRRLESETDRLSAFLRTFNGFTAPRALDLLPTGLSDALEDILFWTRKEARNQKVAITVRVPDDLPPLKADAAQFKQVLLNLMVNALHAMPDGGTLDISAAPEGETIKLEIRDTGTGIPENIRLHIFEPFFTTRPGGSGLGLAIVHKIVREHEAEIAVASEVGRGSCFTLHWPAHS